MLKKILIGLVCLCSVDVAAQTNSILTKNGKTAQTVILDRAFHSLPAAMKTLAKCQKDAGEKKKARDTRKQLRYYSNCDKENFDACHERISSHFLNIVLGDMSEALQRSIVTHENNCNLFYLNSTIK